MVFDPESYRPGQAPERRRRLKSSERPFRAPVDRWLAGGGWDAGRDGAGYVVLVVDTETTRRRMHNRWSYERAVRGWTGRDVQARFAVVAAETRFYWWARRPCSGPPASSTESS